MPLDIQQNSYGNTITITAASGLVSNQQSVLGDTTPTDSLQYYNNGNSYGEGVQGIELISDGGELNHSVSNDGLWMEYQYDDTEYWLGI